MKAPEPGTTRFNCCVCGKSPLETTVYRSMTGLWWCQKHLRGPIITYSLNMQPKRDDDAPISPPEPKRDSAAADSSLLCPASMCPLVAKHGSANSLTYAEPCPEHDDVDHSGCAWWKMGCSTRFQHKLVERARNRRDIRLPTSPKHFDCPHTGICSWQKQADLHGDGLCPPRAALAADLQPSVVMSW
jgi:hypothetical protein